MKFIFCVFISLLLFTSQSFSQIDILGKIKEKAEEKANQKTDEAIDEGFNEVEEELKNNDENKEEKQQQEEEEITDQEEQQNVVTNQDDKKAGLKTYSKYDFIAGEKTVFFDDFSQDAVGDFPLKWNTNSGGEIIEIEGMGKWFHMQWGGSFYPELSGTLPENFTIEFDLIYDLGQNTGGPDVAVDIISTIPDEPMDNLVPGNGGAEVAFGPQSVKFFNWKDRNYGDISNSKEINLIERKSGQVVRISMMAQKQRLRVWLDENKVVDIPRIIPAGLKYDRIRFFEWGSDDPEVKFYIKNFRLAAGIPDMRSKLITEGKLVTHGIYFDSGSDKIKPESYGTLKEIAAVLKENAGIRVKIIGHTDSDGADPLNLELSKKRSLSVKNILASEFGIDVSRMDTDGMGETKPMDVNTTPEGKANNRRVEFIKL